ncbi:hypothetical protein [Mycobacteroides abscessus]|uniref:hypothetical protein n=1 Tax=Mycobacteroides abscessus TaxID=36809 RepID=UPI000C268247|nr:hypothetical protein [Mycobacteroides abscessus]
MSSIEIRKKRNKAIQTLRDTGMSDAEIEEALGHSIKDESEIIDVEIVSETVRTPTQAELVRQYDLSAHRPISMGDSGVQEAESCQISLPARISDASASSKPNGNLGISKWSDEWWAMQSPETQARRCKGHKKTGERCKQAALQGTTVCRVHGGAAPHVKAAARVRLENAADRMAAQLLRLGTEAESETVQLSATNSALDRAGITKPTQVELGPMEPKPYEQILEGITTETREESRARRGYNAYSPNYGTSSPADEYANQSPSGSSMTTPAGQEPATRLEDTAQEGYEPRRERSFDPPAERNGHYERQPSRSDGVGPTHPADKRRERPGHEVAVPDPASGELMNEDEGTLHLARVSNERAHSMPVRHPESPHKRYTAHRRRSIY